MKSVNDILRAEIRLPCDCVEAGLVGRIEEYFNESACDVDVDHQFYLGLIRELQKDEWT